MDPAKTSSNPGTFVWAGTLERTDCNFRRAFASAGAGKEKSRSCLSILAGRLFIHDEMGARKRKMLWCNLNLAIIITVLSGVLYIGRGSIREHHYIDSVPFALKNGIINCRTTSSLLLGKRPLFPDFYMRRSRQLKQRRVVIFFLSFFLSKKVQNKAKRGQANMEAYVVWAINFKSEVR